MQSSEQLESLSGSPQPVPGHLARVQEVPAGSCCLLEPVRAGRMLKRAAPGCAQPSPLAWCSISSPLACVFLAALGRI